MSSAFLTAVSAPSEHVELQLVSDPAPALEAGGLASPVYPLDLGACLPEIPRDGWLYLLYGLPSRLLRSLQTGVLQPYRSQAFTTHGLACIGLIIPSSIDPSMIEDASEVTGYELWPLSDGSVDLSTTSAREPEEDPYFPKPKALSDYGLPYAAAAQIRQFNRNMSAYIPKFARYAPEARDLVEWLYSSLREVSETIRVLDANNSSDARDLERVNNATATLVEANAGMSMLVSQLLAGNQPSSRHDYPIAEYSLFGIGSAVRGLLGVYRGLNRIMTEPGIVTRLEAHYAVGAGFPFFGNRQNLEYSHWSSSGLRLANLSAGSAPVLRRHHIIYFSSRAGFHETLTTMSASWQCVHASASRDWNLLTLSHEYIHALVREVVSRSLGRFSYEELQDIVAKDDPSNAWESLAGAMVTGMHHADRVQSDLKNVSLEQPSFRSPGWSTRPRENEIAALVEGQMRRYLQEMLVHTLDYLYIYAADDELYIASIWGSWRHVPVVMKRLHHYVARSLAALSGRSARPLADPFTDAWNRLANALEAIRQHDPNPVATQALEYMRSDLGNLRLKTEFSQAHYFAQLARSFLFDSSAAAELIRDPLAADVDGVSTYRLDPGDVPDAAIKSPIGFLLDRFRGYAPPPHSAAIDREWASRLEFESAWQLLLLVDAGLPSEEDGRGER